MKIKDGYLKKTIASKDVVVAVGDESRQYNKMITLNETASFLFDMLKTGSDEEKMTNALMSNYEDAKREDVEEDVRAFVAKLKEIGIIVD